MDRLSDTSPVEPLVTTDAPAVDTQVNREPVAPPPSVRDTLLASVAEVEKAEKVPAAPAAAAAVPPKDQQPPAGMVRDPSTGKFVAKPEAAPAAAAAAPKDQPQGQASEASEQDQPNEPPKRWNAELKQLYSTLPQPAQAAMLALNKEMNGHFTRTSTELATQRQTHQEAFAIRDAVTPFAERISRSGRSMAQAVNQVLAMAMQAETDFPGFVREQAAFRGLDLATLAPGQQPPAGDAPADVASHPTFRALQAELDALKTWQTSVTTGQRNQVDQQVTSEIEAFSKDPKNEFFPEVRVHMAALIGNGLAKDLGDAYDQACYANPSIRQKLNDSQHIAAQGAAQRAAAREAEEAKKRGVGVTGAPRSGANGAATAARPGESVSETLRRNASAAG